MTLSEADQATLEERWPSVQWAARRWAFDNEDWQELASTMVTIAIRRGGDLADTLGNASLKRRVIDARREMQKQSEALTHAIFGLDGEHHAADTTTTTTTTRTTDEVEADLSWIKSRDAFVKRTREMRKALGCLPLLEREMVAAIEQDNQRRERKRLRLRPWEAK